MAMSEGKSEHSEPNHQAEQTGFCSALNVLPDAVFVNRRGKLIYANAAMVRFCGVESVEELRGCDPVELFREDERNHIRSRIATVLSGGQVPQAILHLLPKVGSPIPVEMTAVLHRFEGEAAILVVLHDLRLRESLLAARQDAEERFRLMIEGVKDYAIFRMDPGGHITDWNPGAERLYGYSAEEVLGRHYGFLFPSDDRSAAERELDRANREGSAAEEGWRCRRDGSRFWANGTLTKLRGPAGELVGFCKVARDLTERRQLETRLRLVLDHAFDGIISIDEEGIIQSFNLAAEQLFGFAAAEVLGRNIHLLMPEDMRADHDASLRRYREGAPARIIGRGREVEGQRKDGTRFPLEIAVTEFRHEPQGRRFFSGVVRDLSERKRLQEQLRVAQKMEAVGHLAGGIAHDFNNLLTVINGYAEMAVLESEEASPVREAVEAILEAGERAASLTRQLLVFGRHMVVDIRALDLNQVVRDTERMLRRLLGEKVAMTFTAAETACCIRADPGLLAQVLMNLVVNARDAMPEGGTLRLSTRLDGAGGVVLEVSDTGCGMTPEVQARLFNPFFTTKPEGRGTGLGLAVVQNIVTRLEGEISFRSALGQGTTFFLRFPCEDGGDGSASPRRSAAILRGTERVAIIEDDIAVLDVTRRALEQAGYAVQSFANGEQALPALMEAEPPPNLLLADFILPGPNGPEIARALQVCHPGMRVLLMSGDLSTAANAEARMSGWGLLAKPFTPQQLATAVREVLDRPRAAP
jgi:PAS domain S-box-containing protein